MVKACHVKNAIVPIGLTSISALTLDLGTYKLINATGLDEACILLRIISHSKNIIYISFDGVLDHDYLQPGHTLQINTSFNTTSTRFKKISKIYVRGPLSVGHIYLSGYYQAS
jgi:hypothetical protein